jgi:predicted porin
LRVETDDGFALGPRVVVQTLGQGPIELSDRSLVVGTPWGRLELGYRQGLPDTLVGYAPNSYTFTGVEFGPPSGLNLFPHGGLQTSFLAPVVASAVGSLSYLGIATAFAGDRSPKLIYVSPRFLGLQVGLSGATDADPTPFGADYDSSGQAGIVHEQYFGQNVLRIGGSYGVGYRRVQDGSGSTVARALHSGNVGATLVLEDEWILGASASLDYAWRTLRLEDALPGVGYGFTASVNRESGPWDLGGFLQEARRREGSASPTQLFAGEVGASYRLDTQLRFYGALYVFDFRDEDAAAALPHARGGVFLLGARGQL